MSRLVVATVVALALSAVGGVSVAQAQIFFCNGLVEDTTIQGDVVVQNGATCRLRHVMVHGNVVVLSGGALVIWGVSAIAGNLQSTNARFIRILNSSIAGDVQITGTTGLQAGFSWNNLCANAIGGTLQLSSNRAPFAVGDFVACTRGNMVGANVQVTGNTAQVRVSNNRIRGNLQCSGNNPPATGDPGSNMVDGVKQGEGCAFA